MLKMFLFLQMAEKFAGYPYTVGALCPPKSVSQFLVFVCGLNLLVGVDRFFATYFQIGAV